MNSAIVKPKCDLILGSQLSAKRSSTSIGTKSSTRPPKMVSIVDEFALPNMLWNRLSEYCLFSALASLLLLASALLRSALVRSFSPLGPLPVAPCSNWRTRSKSGCPWSGTSAESRRVRLASCSIALCLLSSSRSNLPVQYERLRKFAAKFGTKKQNVGAKLKVWWIVVLRSRNVMLRPSWGRMPWFAFIWCERP